MYYIYRILNKENGKFYIGSTKREPPQLRFEEHLKAAFSPRAQSYNYPLQRDIRTFGRESFSFEVLDYDTSAALIEKKEQQYIAGTDALKNYNQTLSTGRRKE